MEVLITRPVEMGRIDIVALDRAMKLACKKVISITVAHHCDPYAVFVRVAGNLTAEERRDLEAVVRTHVASN